jgi:hypothetical protein
MTSFQYFLYLREEKKHWVLDPVNREGVPAQLFVYYPKSPSQIVPCERVNCRDAISMNCCRRHTKTHSDNNRRHSERDCHRSTTTQLRNADMPSSNHTEVSVHCCHGKHTVASSRTLLYREPVVVCLFIRKLT